MSAMSNKAARQRDRELTYTVKELRQILQQLELTTVQSCIIEDFISELEAHYPIQPRDFRREVVLPVFTKGISNE